MRTLPHLGGILALGRIAFGSCLAALGLLSGQAASGAFSHGSRHSFGPSMPILFASYHPSPRNTNTGRLSKEALVKLLNQVREALWD